MFLENVAFARLAYSEGRSRAEERVPMCSFFYAQGAPFETRDYVHFGFEKVRETLALLFSSREP